MRIIILLLGALLVGACGSSKQADVTPQNPILSATFSVTQLDFEDVDGLQQTDSGYGEIDVSFEARPGILYFNFVSGLQWIVQNLPIVSRAGFATGELQVVTVPFDLGISAGMDVTQIQAAFGLTSTPWTNGLATQEPVAVDQRGVVFSSGEDDIPVFALGPATGLPFVFGAPPGGAAPAQAGAGKAKIPNQECAKKQCAPAAISNSLMYLDMNDELFNENADLSIAAIAAAIGWSPTIGAPGASRATPWWDAKKAALSKAVALGTDDYFIDTEILVQDGTEMNRIEHFDKIIEELEDGSDVEIRVSGHVVLVESVVKMEDGRYTVTIAHDTKQGQPGGTKSETVVYDPSTNLYAGGWAFNGREHTLFVVEKSSV